MSGGFRIALLCCLAAAEAGAATRTLSVAAGRCRDTDLVQLQAAFSHVLGARLLEDAVEPRSLLTALKPPPQADPDALERLVETAQSRFFSGQRDAALAQAREAISGLEKTPPSERAWRLLAAARVLEAQVLRATGKKDAAAESFRRVLRVAPAHALDAGEFSPSTIADFEAARRAVKALPRHPVSVVSQPPGAEVFLDGAPVGKTPWQGTLPAGKYALAVVGPSGAGFPRTLEVAREASASVDLAFEASVAPHLPLCLEGAGEEALGRAVKLGAHAGADLVVLLRLGPRAGEPDWLEAVLLDVARGTKIRAGGMRLFSSRQAGALDALATYVLTGKGSEVVATEATAPRAAGAPAPLEPRRQSEAPAVSTPVTEVAGRGPGARIAGIAVAGVGAAAAVGGAIVFVAGEADRDLLIALKDPQGRLPPEGAQGRDEALALTPRVEANTAAAVALLVGGGVLAVGGAILAIALPPEAPTVGVAVGAEGAALVVAGRF